MKLMAPGSVIIDLAAEQGGNCALSRPGETNESHGVCVYGAMDMPSQLPLHTSLMYSRNVVNAFHNLYAGEDDTIDLADEINAQALVTYKGEVKSELVRENSWKRTRRQGAEKPDEGILAALYVFGPALFAGMSDQPRAQPPPHAAHVGLERISGITLVGALVAAGAGRGGTAEVLGFIAVVLATINVVGGFMVTDRMLGMFKKGRGRK